MLKKLLFFAALGSVAPAMAAAFSLSFTWGDIPLCTSGNPNTVPNPRFVIQGLPPGTETVRLKLVDLDAPRYNHGGATLRLSSDAVIPPGLFTYKSPCPPGGIHTYEWQATAYSGSKQVLGTAAARRSYPE